MKFLTVIALFCLSSSLFASEVCEVRSKNKIQKGDVYFITKQQVKVPQYYGSARLQNLTTNNGSSLEIEASNSQGLKIYIECPRHNFENKIILDLEKELGILLVNH